MQPVDSADSRAATPVRRSRSGCQQCRQRKRKCDEQHPSCSACLQRSLPCQWVREPSRPRVPHRHVQYNKAFEVPRDMRALVTVFTIPTTSIKERLLAHFRSHSPLWLTIGGDTRKTTLLDIIMPVAARSQLVSDCILTLAAGDLSKSEPRSAEMSNLTNSFYGQAMSGLRSELNDLLDPPGPVHLPVGAGDDTLLAVLLLCVHEAVNFTEAHRILPHVNAAAAICFNHAQSTATASRLRALLIEFFCYFFALTSFSHGHALHLHLGRRIFDSPFLAADAGPGVLLSRHCRQVFSCILKVSMLAHRDPQLPPVAEQCRADGLLLLKVQLSGWSSLSLQGDNTMLQSEHVVAELYRLACIVHIQTILTWDYSDDTAELQQLVAEFISVLDRLPPSSPANSILCWPLVVVGMAAAVATHRRLIVGRLRTMHGTWRSDILTKSTELLHSLWREEKTTTSSGIQGTRRAIEFEPGPERFQYPLVLL
ncbi:fungal-specific transcription factor domain-containing protein [Xylariaceae sp. FL1272]|nr:fungal-specific transcription factor domain-containing protein [Xylariaceae sp. FL1272]